MRLNDCAQFALASDGTGTAGDVDLSIGHQRRVIRSAWSDETGIIALDRPDDGIWERIEILGLPDDIADHYGEIHLCLEAMGMPIGPNDLLSAAPARGAGLVVVTGNDREFSPRRT